MSFKEFTERFLTQLEKLDRERLVHIGVFVCKKLYPEYEKFELDNSWGNSKLLLLTIDSLENFISSEKIDFNLKKRINEVEKITPDTEDFGDSSYALNACTAVLHTMSYLDDFDVKNMYYAGMAYIDTIDSKLLDENNLSENEIDNHIEMVKARNQLLELSKS